MTELFLHGRSVNTVFSLLGKKENDITYSVGWGLAQCDSFLTALLKSIYGSGNVGSVIAVSMQKHGKDGGYTDIEIVTERIHLIIEAKRGWNVPGVDQLERYKARFTKGELKAKLLVLSECSSNYAEERLPKMIRDVPVVDRSWKQVRDVARQSAQHATHAEKRLLRELCQYLETLMTMQNQTSNEVYVTVLSPEIPDWSDISWRDFVTKHRRYFHPIRSRFPKEPPNYMGFRYGGSLQSIHHVDSYQIVTDVSKRVPYINGTKWRKERYGEKYFIYHLGPPIRPQREVRNGPIYGPGSVKASLDLLLTCRTIAEAVKKTKQRPQE